MALNPRLSGRVAARAHHSPAAAILQKIEPFFSIGQVSGGPLFIATICALLIVNSPFGADYVRLWDRVFSFRYGAWTFGRPAAEWINDALMPLFFLIVGTEVKREFTKGSLSSWHTAIFPVAGAIGGLIVPVLLYLAWNWGGPAQHGWGVVAAMDTAFSLAIVAMFTTRLPPAVRAVLLAFAAIDDVFGLLIIAIAYTATIDWWFLAAAGVAYLGIVGLLRLRWVAAIPYVLLGVVVWIGIFGSGIHPTIAGVAVGLLLPTNSRLSGERFAERVQRPVDQMKRAQAAADHTDDPDVENAERARAQQRLGYIHEMAAATDEAAERLVRILTPWVSYIVLPLFALSNARIHFSAQLLGEALHSPITAGVVAGLVIGKPVGFVGATWLATRFGGATLPEGVAWPMVLGIGAVAGIGFTIALFIADLAFAAPEQVEQAALGILVASAVSGLFGYIMFRTATARTPDV